MQRKSSILFNIYGTVFQESKINDNKNKSRNPKYTNTTLQLYTYTTEHQYNTTSVHQYKRTTIQTAYVKQQKQNNKGFSIKPKYLHVESGL